MVKIRIQNIDDDGNIVNDETLEGKTLYFILNKEIKRKETEGKIFLMEIQDFVAEQSQIFLLENLGVVILSQLLKGSVAVKIWKQRFSYLIFQKCLSRRAIIWFMRSLKQGIRMN